MQDLGYSITRPDLPRKQFSRPLTPKYEKIYSKQSFAKQLKIQLNNRKKIVLPYERSYKDNLLMIETKDDVSSHYKEETNEDINSVADSFFTNILMRDDSVYEVLDMPKKPRLIGVTRPPSGYFYVTPEEYLTKTNKEGKRSPLNRNLVKRWIKIRDAKPTNELSRRESLVIGRAHDRCKSKTRPGSLEGSIADIDSLYLDSPVDPSLFKDENDENTFFTQKNIMSDGKAGLSPKFNSFIVVNFEFKS